MITHTDAGCSIWFSWIQGGRHLTGASKGGIIPMKKGANLRAAKSSTSMRHISMWWSFPCFPVSCGASLFAAASKLDQTSLVFRRVTTLRISPADARDIGAVATKSRSIIPFWLVVWTPLKNISQLGWLFPIYAKIKNGNQTTNQHLILVGF